MKISDNTSISMPMRNLLGLIAAIGIGIFAYSDLTQRLTQLETARQLMEADLLKKAEQTPVNQELYMLLEFLAGQNEVMEKEIQSIESNNINIDFIKTQVEKLQNDVEQQTKEDSRENAKDLKETINSVEDDMKKLEEKIKLAQKELEEKIDKRIKSALENPLGG